MITVSEAAGVFPELGRLYTVLVQRSPEWAFVPLIKGHQLEGLHGSRVWPDGTVDQFGIRSQTDAAACRINPLREQVWFASGTVGDVVDRLLEELVAPFHPAAPTRAAARVIAAAGLAVPGQRAIPVVSPADWLLI